MYNSKNMINNESPIQPQKKKNLMIFNANTNVNVKYKILIAIVNNYQ